MRFDGFLFLLNISLVLYGINVVYPLETPLPEGRLRLTTMLWRDGDIKVRR